jgi:hypothetical protein
LQRFEDEAPDLAIFSGAKLLEMIALIDGLGGPSQT